MPYVSEEKIRVEMQPNSFCISAPPENIVLTITNLADTIVRITTAFNAEMWDGENWVGAVFQYITFSAYTNPVNPGETYQLPISLQPNESLWMLGDTIAPGLYRVIFHGHYAEFTIS
jgi:hypothetical protein